MNADGVGAFRYLTARPLLAVAVVAVLFGGAFGIASPFLWLGGGDGARPIVDDDPGGPAAVGQPPVAPPVGDTAEPGPVFRNAVPPIPTVTAAAELGPVKQHPRVSARDNGQSVRYADRSVWLFADTVFRNPFGVVSNTGAVTTDLAAADGLNLTSNNPFTLDTATDPVELIPLRDDERRFEAAHNPSIGCSPSLDDLCAVRFAFWPGAVVADPARGRILMFYAKLCRGSHPGTACYGALGTAIGSGVAEMDMGTRRVTRLAASGRASAPSVEGPDPTMFFTPGAEFGSAALTVGGTVYVYGGCTYAGCKLARVDLADVDDRSRWTFFTGRDRRGTDRWSDDPADAVNTIAAGGAGQTVLWNPALRCFLNVLLPYGTNRAVFQVGGSPFGPWSATHPLADTESGGTQPNYALFGHAEYSEQNGLLQYLSYFQPATGQLRLVRVTFQPRRVGS